jgi:hypothetical protein
MTRVIFLAAFVNDPSRIDPSLIDLLVGIAIALAGFALVAWRVRHRAGGVNRIRPSESHADVRRRSAI